ncbi:MAG: hypothetical protein EOO17_00860 [Chloroflexi bacterium]|nr:MAG: hypothetical protein EOO17_00860 [Chloroflexota bacterium]
MTGYVPIKGFEPYYSINREGEILSHRFGLPLKHNLSTDYPRVTLYKPGVRGKTKSIHRLLCEHFIKNPKNLPLVNHINGNTNDFRLNNLEWASHEYNVKDGYNRGRVHPQQGKRYVDRKRECEMCKQTFEYVKPQQRFCSKKCAGINNLKIAGVVALHEAGELK